MESRKMMCTYCRQRAPVPITSTTSGTAKSTYITKFRCPACNQMNNTPIQPSPTSSPSSGSGFRNSPDPYSMKIKSYKSCFNNKFCSRIGRASRSNGFELLESSGKNTALSMNSNPSPLDIPSPVFDHRPIRKRALLIGVSYKKFSYRLKGTINDVRNMKELLMKSFKYKQSDILVLTEEEPKENLIPTKHNIHEGLKWLINDIRSGDSLVFYFSGHGLRQPDFDQDEIDGFDESICPTDFMKEGMILDNDIHKIIVSPLTEGVKLHAIVDSCHSGTVLDLPNVYDRITRKWVDNSPPSGVKKTTKGGLAISISACEDHQVAADTTAFTGKTMNGALTYILADIVKKHPGPTYGDLLDMIHEAINRLNQSGCLSNVKILRKIFDDKLSQKPMLSSSERFDVYQKHFIL